MLLTRMVSCAFLLALAAFPAAANAAGERVSVPATFRDLGPAQANLPVRIALTLAYRHQAELDALVRAQSDRTSPAFHHYLSSAQFAAYFAPDASTYASVARTLNAAGFTIAQTFPNRTVIDAVGPSSAAERLFATEIHAGVQAGHGARYVNLIAPTIPASLRDVVTAVSGLDDLVSLAPRYELGHGGASGDALGGPLKGPKGGDGPLAFAQGYDEPIQHGAYDGSTRSIANVMAGDIRTSDLATYLQQFSITPAHQLQRIAVDGGAIGKYDVETTLDIEAMTGTAPGAQVYLYSFPEFTDADAEDAYNQVVSDDLVDAANSSWGGCEADKKGALGYYFAIASNSIFEQGAAEGITFPVATGDQGWRTCVTDRKVNETTADSDSYALAVGGTTLHVDRKGNWKSERAWDGSAGGVSVVFTLPAYQTGVPNVIASGRNIPDVSLDADPATGMAEFLDNQWFYVGGTSMASPLWVGLEAQIDQYEGTRIGFVNPELYTLLQGSQYSTLFHDITAGSNGRYDALPGFDQVTGVGTPSGWALAQAGL